MNKECVVYMDVGKEHGNIGLRFNGVDHFGSMENAIRFWDPFHDSGIWSSFRNGAPAKMNDGLIEIE